jgi:hypothetical protein
VRCPEYWASQTDEMVRGPSERVSESVDFYVDNHIPNPTIHYRFDDRLFDFDKSIQKSLVRLHEDGHMNYFHSASSWRYRAVAQFDKRE